MAALDPNVARESPQPTAAESAPQDKPEQNKDDAENDKHFTNIRHGLKRLRPPLLGATVSATMQLGQLSEASLYASDLAAARHFYHAILGLEVVSTLQDRGIAFRCGMTVLLVFDPMRTRVRDAGVPAHGAIGPGHVAFVVEEEDLGKWREHFAKHGIAIEEEVVWPRGDRSLYFRDPAGNVIEFAPPAMWRSSESE